jgi:hypothetical protein
MITSIVIFLLICLFFLPIVGVYIGVKEALVSKSDWQKQNIDAGLKDGR